MNDKVKEIMENAKHYPTHPGAEHPPIMTCVIPLEEYESIKRENAELKSDIADLRYDKKLTDAILDERNAEIAELKAQKAQLEDDCAYWKNMAQKNADDNAVMAKQREEAIKHYIELADKLKEKN